MSDDAATLASLANGIIPADARDAGAAEVGAGARLAERLAVSATYANGVSCARDLARADFGREVHELDPDQVCTLLAKLQESAPVFVNQLRMDVVALYVSDPAVASRMGFSGPSLESGGHPDFDQPQADQRPSDHR